jgi:hypothetical protein
MRPRSPRMEDISVSRAKCLVYIGSVAVTMTVASCGPSSHELRDAKAPPASSLQAPANSPEIAPLADSRVGDATRHWVQDAQLRALMKSLVAKTQRNLPNGLSQDPEDSQASEPRNAMGAARLADGLAASAVRIPASVAAMKMSEADRAGFQAEADTLHDLALRLG